MITRKFQPTVLFWLDYTKMEQDCRAM